MSALHTMMVLVMKTTYDGNLDDEGFDRALLAWPNTATSQGSSLPQVHFGYPVWSVVPTRQPHIHRNGTLPLYAKRHD